VASVWTLPPLSMDQSQLKSLLAKFEIRPNKGLGQHFLHDETVIADMLEAADVQSDDTILEVGPGLGVLTSALVQRAGQVVVYELDEKLAALIESQQAENLTVVLGDALELPLPPRGTTLPYKVVANIPYSITGALIRRLITSPSGPSSITLLVQKEVAERMCAKPGQMSVLSVAVQLHGTAHIDRLVPPECFWPAPKVDSAVVHVDLAGGLMLDVEERDFMRLVKFGFAQKRKQLKNTLAAGLRIEPTEVERYLLAVGLTPTARAQELSLAQWKQLYDLIEK
jgi:16S rRNA (adenine1518-N6/adenine1519-N6)-dimethyltransferase